MHTTDLYEQSYVPYSSQPAAAVVRSKEGRYFPGKRIENIAYPLTIGAAQSAFFSCLSEGEIPAEVATTKKEDPMLEMWKREYGLEISALDPKNLPDYSFANIQLSKQANPEKTLLELLDQAIVGESNFPVASLVETELGFFSGVNIEFSEWTMGLCAERIAIAKALSYGSTKFRRLHIRTRKGEFSSPCGACRQVIVEHMPNKQVHLYHADHSESIHFSKDLLPYNFQSSALTNP